MKPPTHSIEQLFAMVPKPLLKLQQNSEEAFAATGVVRSDKEIYDARMQFLMGCFAAYCFIQEPQEFQKLNEKLNEIVMESLTT